MKRNLIGIVMLLVIVWNIGINAQKYNTEHPIVYTAHAQEEEHKVVLIEPTYSEESIKMRIKEAFPEDSERMLRVALCESGYDRNAHNPKNNSHDRGIFQLSEKWHGKEMKELGIDPTDVEQNIQYARLLYDRNGLKDWSASKKCWSK